MRQGETEGREGALGYSCRSVRRLRRNDTVITINILRIGCVDGNNRGYGKQKELY